MTKAEKISVSVFMTIIAGVCAVEIYFVLEFVIGKLTNAQAGNILLSNAAIVTHLFALLGAVCLLYGYFRTNIQPYEVIFLKNRPGELIPDQLNLLCDPESQREVTHECPIRPDNTVHDPRFSEDLDFTTNVVETNFQFNDDMDEFLLTLKQNFF